MDDSKTIDLLMEIRENVASLNEKFSGLEKSVNTSIERNKDDIDHLRKEVETLRAEVTELRNKDNKEDAHNWRKAKGYILAVIGTTIVTFLLSHLGDLIRSFGGL